MRPASKPGVGMKFSVRNYARLATAAVTRRVPVYAHFGVTHRCNLTCKMCGIWRYGNRKEELDMDQMALVAERMARLGVVQLSIGGGEPYAVDYIEDAAKLFIDQGLNLRILTNGIGNGNGRNEVDKPYLDRIDKTMANGVKNFSISLDSLYPARFDYICEVDGAWVQAVRTMTHIGQALKNVPGALPNINCVVSNLNLEELPDMVRFAREIGFSISFLPVELRLLGSLPHDDRVVRSVRAREPATYAYPSSDFSQAVRGLATRLLAESDVRRSGGQVRYFSARNIGGGDS